MVGELRAHTLIAVYRDLELAQEAVGVLRGDGFGDDELIILGQSPEDTERVEHGEGEPVGGDVVKKTMLGGAGGGALGAALGAAGAVAVTAIPGIGLLAGPAALIGAISGVFAGSTAGSVVVGRVALQSASGWAETFESLRTSRQGGGVAVGIHTDDADATDRAAETLKRTSPLAVHRLNSQGHAVA